MIVLVGHSGSGKNTVMSILVELGFHPIVSYTTRPPRDNEIHGLDYYFASPGMFSDLDSVNFFAETAEYRGWWYGTPLNECKFGKIKISESIGLKTLKQRFGDRIISIYVNSSELVRQERLVKRGDDRIEIARRIVADKLMFEGIADQVDFILNNDYDNYPQLKKETRELYDSLIDELSLRATGTGGAIAWNEQ